MQPVLKNALELARLPPARPESCCPARGSACGTHFPWICSLPFYRAPWRSGAPVWVMNAPLPHPELPPGVWYNPALNPGTLLMSSAFSVPDCLTLGLGTPMPRIRPLPWDVGHPAPLILGRAAQRSFCHSD